MTLLIVSIASFIAGFVDAVAGGGGVITFPAFLMLGLPVSEIVATNKLVSTSGTTVAAYTFIKTGTVQKDIVSTAVPFTFVGAIAGAASVLILPNEFLKPCISVLVIAVAVYCYLRPSMGSDHLFTGLTNRSRLITRLGAFGIGFYDGFFGPGTGIFLTFFFVKTLGCDFLHSTANTKVVNWVSNVVALVYFFTQGHVRFDIGVPMLLANIAGGYVGAHAAIAKGSGFIKWIYLIMAILTGMKLIFGF